jgi:hypothetical protein
MRTSSLPSAEWAAGSQQEQQAARVLRRHIEREWRARNGAGPSDTELTALLRLVHVQVLDVDPAGQAEQEAKNTAPTRY